VINQNAVDPALVDIATTVDDLDGRDCSLRVEYSLDGGAKWHRAAISDVYSAEFGEVEIGNDSDFQLSGIETHQAGANTVRLQWDTQSSANGSGALDESSYSQVLLRTTQSNGEVEREPQVSTKGFYRKFPAVVVDDSPLELRFD
jgi:hypothetical protein